MPLNGRSGLAERLSALRRARIGDAWILLALALIFLIAYLAQPALPGNQPQHPLGWWGWTDQGQYLKSARAFAQGDISWENHFYPPLYAFLASFFVKFLPNHPFVLIDLTAFLLFGLAFFRAGRLAFPDFVLLPMFVAAAVMPRILLAQYVVPWTSSGTLLLSSFLLLSLVGVAEGGPVSRRGALAFGFAAGLVLPCRPADLTVVFPMALAYVWHGIARAPVPAVRRGQLLLAVAGGGIVGPLAYVFLNLKTHGHPFGVYYDQTVNVFGFAWADLGEKLFSLLLDSRPLYLEDDAIARRFKVIYLALPALVWTILRGPWLFRTIALAVAMQFAVYACYVDLLPTGLWRYFNVHYFKWSYPFLLLFPAIFVRDIYRGWRATPSRAAAWTGATVILLVAALGLRMEFESPSQAQATLVADDGEPIVLRVSSATELDAIDVQGVGGPFPDVYFGDHLFRSGQHSLRKTAEFRILPSENGIRVLFIRPTVMEDGELRLDPRLKALGGETHIRLLRYRFGWG